MPRLSLVILTLNEEKSIAGCLRALAEQTSDDFEVIVVDAASSDATVAVARAAGAALPLRIHADPERLPIGAARNLGARLAKAPVVAYVSADAHLEPRWVEEALATLERADMAFGRQVHAPQRWTTAAAVRGLRYHFPDGPSSDALRFASNVAGAYRKEILLRFPFDDDADAAEDLVVARQAVAAGYTAEYNPRMVVFHGDVATARQELRKNVREGRGWAAYRGHLGLARGWLAWGGTVAGTAALIVVHPAWAVACGGALWAPTARRAIRNSGSMPPHALWRAVMVSPAYDLAFLANYVRALVKPAR